MDEQKLNRFREMLMTRKGELESEIESISEQVRDLSIEQENEGGTLGNHFADDGSSLNEQETLATLEADFRDQLDQVNNALKRISEGRYGICQRCGKPINEERLEALPFAAFCIECQSLMEQQAALYGTAAPNA
jgi:DnaK suppressor protein